MQSRNIKVGIAVALLVLVGSIIYVALPACGGEKSVAIMGEDVRIIEVCSRAEQIKGLGDLSLADFEAKADGMVFRFKEAEERNFWMKNMQFPIDIVWVRDGRIMKIDENVPAPQKGEKPETRSSSPFSVDTVLELPAGGVAKYGLTLGLMVSSLQ